MKALFFAVCILMSFSLEAQRMYTQRELTYQKQDDGTVLYHDKETGVALDGEFGFYIDRIRYSMSHYKKGLLHGKDVYYESGKLLSESNYVKGKLEGVKTYYSGSTGEVRKTERYKNGKLHGDCVSLIETVYMAGEPTPGYKRVETYDKNKKLREKQYYLEGSLMKDIQYVDSAGIALLKEQHFYEDGTLKYQEYRENGSEVWSYSYYPGGSVKSNKKYEEKKEGRYSYLYCYYTEYYSDGIVKEERTNVEWEDVEEKQYNKEGVLILHKKRIDGEWVEVGNSSKLIEI